MFTGLIQAVGVIEAIEDRGGARRLLIHADGWAGQAEAGESVNVHGCCLTLAEPPGRTDGSLAFDVIPETLRRSALDEKRRGDRVNLERSLRADSLIGGHFVQGHVDGVGRVMDMNDAPGERRLRIEPPAELMDCVAPKGSVAIDGVSLTIALADEASFEVALIPTTLDRTTLGELRAGDRCNIETDVIARTVVHYLNRRGE